MKLFNRNKTHSGYTRPEVRAMLDKELQRHDEVMNRLVEYASESDLQSEDIHGEERPKQA